MLHLLSSLRLSQAGLGIQLQSLVDTSITGVLYYYHALLSLVYLFCSPLNFVLHLLY